MEAKNIGFFEEDEGHKSSTRLNAFLLLMFTCFVIGMWVYRSEEITMEFLFLVVILLAGVFTPKSIQKLAELKFGKTDAAKP